MVYSSMNELGMTVEEMQEIANMLPRIDGAGGDLNLFVRTVRAALFQHAKHKIG
jgi:hypothetical protein